jgi:hypothetical protein
MDKLKQLFAFITENFGDIKPSKYGHIIVDLKGATDAAQVNQKINEFGLSSVIYAKDNVSLYENKASKSIYLNKSRKATADSFATLYTSE